MRLWIFRGMACCLLVTLLTQCGLVSVGGNMGGPSEEQRAAAIASEATGNFFYGRRYFVEKTRFWGYLREPRQSWSQARLVMMNESKKRVPDRLSEDGPPGHRYGFDANHEYRIFGHFTGRQAYDPNSNQALPEFMLTGYQLVDREPGWLFSPKDRYSRHRITLLPR